MPFWAFLPFYALLFIKTVASIAGLCCAVTASCSPLRLRRRRPGRRRRRPHRRRCYRFRSWISLFFFFFLLFFLFSILIDFCLWVLLSFFFLPDWFSFWRRFFLLSYCCCFFVFFGLFCSDAVVARVILIEFWSYWTIAVFVTKSAERHQPGTEWSRHATPRISFWNYHLNDLADHVFEYRGLLLEIYLHRKESHL